MVELYDLIHKIEKRPAMYLGQPSITHLSAFLSGYFFARRQLSISETEQEREFSEFQTWIQQKFDINSSQSWDKIILFFSQDEHSALSQFFILFNEFSNSDKHHSIRSISSTIAS